MARRHKRLWTDEEKRSICHQTRAPRVSVAPVARRYAVNANLIFKWLRDPRFAFEEEAQVVEGIETAAPQMAGLLLVDLVAEVDDEADCCDGSPRVAPTGGVIQIERAGGHRLRIEGAYDPDALARLLRGLAGGSLSRRGHGSSWRRA